MYEKIKSLQATYPERPKKPMRPILPKDANSKQAGQFAKALYQYEEDMAQWVLDDHAYKVQVRVIDDEIKELVKRESGFYSIPEVYQDKVWTRAWEDGHGSGWYDIYLHLCNLVEIFDI